MEPFDPVLSKATALQASSALKTAIGLIMSAVTGIASADAKTPGEEHTIAKVAVAMPDARHELPSARRRVRSPSMTGAPWRRR